MDNIDKRYAGGSTMYDSLIYTLITTSVAQSILKRPTDAVSKNYARINALLSQIQSQTQQINSFYLSYPDLETFFEKDVGVDLFQGFLNGVEQMISAVDQLAHMNVFSDKVKKNKHEILRTHDLFKRTRVHSLNPNEITINNINLFMHIRAICGEHSSNVMLYDEKTKKKSPYYTVMNRLIGSDGLQRYNQYGGLFDDDEISLFDQLYYQYGFITNTDTKKYYGDEPLALCILVDSNEHVKLIRVDLSDIYDFIYIYYNYTVDNWID